MYRGFLVFVDSRLKNFFFFLATVRVLFWAASKKKSVECGRSSVIR